MLANGLVIVGRNGANLSDHLAGNFLRILVDGATLVVALFVHCAANRGHSLFDAALQRHRVRAGGNCLDAFAVNGLRQNSRGGGAVTGHVGGLGSDLAHHLRAHVFERILQLDFFCYGHAVFGNQRRTELLLDHHIAALRTEGDLDRIGQDVHAAKDRLA